MIVRDHPFLEMVLGLRQACTRLDEILDHYAPEDAATNDAGEVDDGVALLLGMIAIRRRLGTALAATQTPPDAPANTAPPLAVDHESWLR